jgi:hypothetical protein
MSQPPSVGPNAGASTDAESEDSHRSTLLFRRESFPKNRLRYCEKNSSADSLQRAEEHHRRKIARETARHRCEREYHDAGHVEILAAEALAEQRDQRHDDHVGEDVALLPPT